MSEPTDASPEPIVLDAPPPTPPQSARTKWLRIGALVVLTIALIGIGHATGLTEHLTRDRIQALMLDLGALGFLAYVGIFAVGELMHVPGMIFVGAAMLAYGPALGAAAGLAGAIVSLTVSFYVVRVVGGQPLGEIKRPFIRRMLAHLDQRPITTIAILRVLFQLMPAINYGLAMSKVRYRDYIVGSVVGMVPVIAVAALAFDWFFGT
ncbi:MAG: VTT domain-containing protein [Myxococcota bacterium]|nr:VTT domain-containing protein [Myxococcota bacterium]